MSKPLVPTLLYPNGGESIVGSELVILWQEVISEDNSPIAYELYYTDGYRYDEEPDWQQIAVVPAGTSNFQWRFGKALKSTRCRVAVRTINGRGERSDYSLSAADFAIQRKKLNAPSILNPVANTHYDRYIEITTDDSGIIGTYSQRSYYQFYYSSVSAGIQSTPIAQNVSIGSDPVFWDVSALPAARDYILQTFLSDDDGNVSDSVFIRDINISHEGFFIIDTTAPIASIVVNNNDTFTTEREVSVSIVSYDATTGVHSMLLTDGETTSKPDAIADVKRFILSAENEVKAIQLRLQDFGANRSDDDGVVKRLFENTIEISGTEVVDLAADRDNHVLWCVISGTNSYLYKVTDFPSRKATLLYTPTAVAFYKGSVYVAMNDGTDKAVFQRYDGSQMTDTKVLDEADSVINTMEVHGDYLYLGMENGIVYRFDTLNFDIQDELPNPVNTMFSDGNLLYLTQKNDFDVYVFNGTVFFSTGA